MKIAYAKDAKEFKNSDACTALEYPLHDPDINAAVVKINGRYPDAGLAVNTKVREMIYIIEGQGTLMLEGKSTILHKGDVVLIEPNEKYFWQGDLTMFVPCTPAWSPEQHHIHPVD